MKPIDRLRQLEAILVHNKNAWTAYEANLAALEEIRINHLFTADGCKSFYTYCYKNATRFGIKYAMVMRKLQLYRDNKEAEALAGLQFSCPRASGTFAKAVKQLTAEKRTEAMQVFKKEIGDAKASSKDVRKFISKHHEFGFTAVGDDYPTPPEIINPLIEAFHFDLDAAASPHNAKAPTFFTARQDGLKQDWTKFKAVWVNPPFSDITPWIEKAEETAMHGTLVVVLSPASTDTEWFQWHGMNADIVFVKERVRFVGAGESNPYPSMLTFWHLRKFTDAQIFTLTDLGLLVSAQFPLYEMAFASGPKPKQKTLAAFKKHWGW